MQVQISGKQIEITPALRTHVQRKLDRLARHYDNLTDLTVVLSVDKLEQRADGTLLGAGCNLHAVGNNLDMYNSIDLMFDKLVGQLRRHKEKRADHRAREGRAMHTA